MATLHKLPTNYSLSSQVEVVWPGRWFLSGDLRFPAVWSAAAEAMLCPCKWFWYRKIWRNRKLTELSTVWLMATWCTSPLWPQEKKHEIYNDFSLKTKIWHRKKPDTNFPTLKLSQNSPQKFPGVFSAQQTRKAFKGLRPTKRKGRSWGLKCQTSVGSETLNEQVVCFNSKI